jgi:hypothetical protein
MTTWQVSAGSAAAPPCACLADLRSSSINLLATPLQYYGMQLRAGWAFQKYADADDRERSLA